MSILPRSGGQRVCQHWKQPNGVHWCHFHFHISHKVAKSMVKLTSQLSGDLQLHGCLLVQGRWSHLKTTWARMDVWQASETSRSRDTLANFQHQYSPELLVNVPSYHVMVESVSCCCVGGRWLFSNPVANKFTFFLHTLNWLDNISALKIPASECTHHSTHCQANEEAIKAIDSDLTNPVRFTLYWNLYLEY